MNLAGSEDVREDVRHVAAASGVCVSATGAEMEAGDCHRRTTRTAEQPPNPSQCYDNVFVQ